MNHHLVLHTPCSCTASAAAAGSGAGAAGTASGATPPLHPAARLAVSRPGEDSQRGRCSRQAGREQEEAEEETGGGRRGAPLAVSSAQCDWPPVRPGRRQPGHAGEAMAGRRPLYHP